MKNPKKRMYLTGPHNIIVLSKHTCADEDGIYAEFYGVPLNLRLLTPSGTEFTVEVPDFLVPYPREAAA